MSRFFVLGLCLLWACGSSSPSAPAARRQQSHSSSIAIAPDGSRLFVVHPDADVVSIVDTASRSISQEIRLGGSLPAVDPATVRFDPSVMPRALALDSTGASLYVTGERSGQLYAIDVKGGAIRGSAVVCSEPVGVVVGADDSKLFVACAQDDEVVELDAATLSTLARAPTLRKPWTLAWAPDGTTLLATHLLGPGVSALATSPLSVTGTWAVPDVGPQPDPTEPHGLVRGIYDAVARPGSEELWVAHLMLGTDTTQPALEFDNTVFPALSVLDGTGAQLGRLSVQANGATADDSGAFGDVVSGPRALTFSADGRYAFVVDADSEDLLVVDAQRRIEATLVRPLPGHLPEGVVSYGSEVYVEERNTEDIVAFVVDEGQGDAADAPSVTQDGDAFTSLSSDPMPAELRLGQKLFYSADSDDVPITQNHWVACASCHIEGRSDAVTWLFEQGPRDTPTNAGGMLDTGFLFRTADRSQVEDYWKTIDVEQGGHFARGNAQQPLLDAIAAYVNHAIPVPVPPSTDAGHQLRGDALASLRAQGAAVFQQVGCATCHSGPAKTDSGAGNPTLDLGGPILLHDVGTCVTGGPWPDVVHLAIDGRPRAACAFDTPALRGLVDSAPYMHDGSAATLNDVLPRMLRAAAGTTAAPPALGAADEQALVEYLRSL
jgi:DNA-binding beta-propeller fold protein YncE